MCAHTHTHTCKYNVRRLAIPLFFFALFAPFLLLSQPVVNMPRLCGTPEPTAEELNAIYQRNSTMNVASGFTVTCEIPIHLYIINGDNGEPLEGYTNEYILYQAFEHIETANTWFTNGMSFYICKVTYINNTDLQTPASLTALYNAAHDDDAINIYLTDGLEWDNAPGVTGEVIALVAPGNAELMAHELGHYFSLLHTFQNRITPLPDNSCNPDPDWPFDCLCGLSCNGDNSGDGINDTPVDPGLGTFTTGGTVYTYCSGINPCVPLKNGQPIPYSYYPDGTNLMSYYGLSDHFTTRQLQVMLNYLLTNSTVSHLVDTNVPVCDEIEPPVNVLLAESGYVNKVAQIEDQIELTPLEHSAMNVFDIANTTNCYKFTDAIGHYKSGQCTPAFLQDVNFRAGQSALVNSLNQGTYPVFRANNGVNITDVIWIRRHILNITPLPIPYAQIAADVNNDGKISTFDVIFVNRIILGIDEEFANVPSWRFLPEHSLGSQFTFQPFLDFDPFTAVWQAPDGARHYRAADSPVGKSYLDDIELNLLNPDVPIAPTWSFRAIKSGDVNFNADVDGLLSEGGNGYAFSATSHACLQPGQTATVLVKARTTDDIDAYQMGLTFDKDAIEVIGVNQGDVAPFSLDHFGFNQLAEGELRMLWTDEKGGPIKFENNLKTLFKINIKAVEVVCDIGSVIEIEDDVLAGIFLDTEEEVVPMTRQLELIPGIIRHKLEQVYPNPTGSSISFQVDLGEAATVSAQVFDQFGNYLTTSGSYGAGEQTIVFNNTSSLQQGTLSYVITAGSETFTGKHHQAPVIF